jgi:hypothetical protein
MSGIKTLSAAYEIIEGYSNSYKCRANYKNAYFEKGEKSVGLKMSGIKTD